MKLNAEVKVLHPLGNVIAHEPALILSIENLISNALKFSRPGLDPKIVISSERIRSNVRLKIEDNGIGISEQYQDRIFGIFQHLERTGDLKGTGIGLALVKKAIEKMSGKVGVHSKVVEGSCFWIELPAPSEDYSQDSWKSNEATEISSSFASR